MATMFTFGAAHLLYELDGHLITLLLTMRHEGPRAPEFEKKIKIKCSYHEDDCAVLWPGLDYLLSLGCCCLFRYPPSLWLNSDTCNRFGTGDKGEFTGNIIYELFFSQWRLKLIELVVFN